MIGKRQTIKMETKLERKKIELEKERSAISEALRRAIEQRKFWEDQEVQLRFRLNSVKAKLELIEELWEDENG